MSCWKCPDCNTLNCDVDDCVNGACPSHTAYTYDEIVAKISEVETPVFIPEILLQDVIRRGYNQHLYDRKSADAMLQKLRGAA